MTGTNSSGGPFRSWFCDPLAAANTLRLPQARRRPWSATSTHVFPTSLPIQSGDLIGLDTTNLHDKVGLASTTSAEASRSGVLSFLKAIRQVPPFGSSPKSELGFNAEVQPPPGIGSVSPSSGPTSGGASVVLTGHDFTGASAVKFGSTPASSFTVTPKP